MAFIDRKEIMQMTAGKAVSLLALLNGAERKMTKADTPYYMGNLQCNGVVPFKVWNNAPAFNFLDTLDKSKGIVELSGKIDTYGGSVSVVVDTMRWASKEACGDMVELDFYESVYDQNKYMAMLRKQLQDKCSPEAVLVFEHFMKLYEKEYMTEFAAINHHDNCKSGLLAHTVKMLKIANMLNMYKNLWGRVTPDLLYVGCALHDIGKVMEYDGGAISEMGKRVSHLTIGIVMLTELKDDIVKLKGEEYFWDLCAIVSEHHGEWGDRPRTVASYVIHLFDKLESVLASLNELAEVNGQIVYDSCKLN